MTAQNGRREDELLQVIVGEQLSSVEFVQDYVQLKFDGPALSAFTWPVVEIDGREFHYGEPGFRDELCNRIARIVSSARIRFGESLRVEFDDGATVRVSLYPDDYGGPEALKFDSESGWWVL